MGKEMHTWVAYGTLDDGDLWTNAGFQDGETWLASLHAPACVRVQRCGYEGFGGLWRITVSENNFGYDSPHVLNFSDLEARAIKLGPVWDRFSQLAWPNGDGPTPTWICGADYF